MGKGIHHAVDKPPVKDVLPVQDTAAATVFVVLPRTGRADAKEDQPHACKTEHFSLSFDER